MKRYRQAFLAEEGTPPGVSPWPIWRITDHGDEHVDGGVVVEDPLDVRIDGRTVAVLMRTPGMEKELAAGFVLGEGLVADVRDIALVRHCGRAVPNEFSEGDPLDVSRNQVDVTLMPGIAAMSAGSDIGAKAQLIRSGCGRTDAGSLAEDLAPVDAAVKIPAAVLPHLLGQITRQQAAYRAAGGIHAAAVFDNRGRSLVVCEDIGRHNAVDKTVGYCLLRGISLQDKVLVSTGRASYDMIAKGVRLGIPIMASISSPTSLAVELAQALNCTLIGYLRGKSFNVYTHGWRVHTSE